MPCLGERAFVKRGLRQWRAEVVYVFFGFKTEEIVEVGSDEVPTTVEFR